MIKLNTFSKAELELLNNEQPGKKIIMDIFKSVRSSRFRERITYGGAFGLAMLVSHRDKDDSFHSTKDLSEPIKGNLDDVLEHFVEELEDILNDSSDLGLEYEVGELKYYRGKRLNPGKNDLYLQTYVRVSTKPPSTIDMTIVQEDCSHDEYNEDNIRISADNHLFGEVEIW